MISQSTAGVAYTQTYQNMDRGLLEFFGPQGFATQIYMFTTKTTNVSLGFIHNYLFLFLISLFTILLIIGA